MAAGVPALAKLHAIKHVTSKVVAVELLKETGLESSNAVVALAAALSPSILTGLLDCSRLIVANLLICYNAYKQVRAPGCRAYSLTEILSNLTNFRSFILVVIRGGNRAGPCPDPARARPVFSLPLREPGPARVS
jgi:hypothetical protein